MSKFANGDFVEIVSARNRGIFGKIEERKVCQDKWVYNISGYGMNIPEDDLEKVDSLPRFRHGMRVGFYIDRRYTVGTIERISYSNDGYSYFIPKLGWFYDVQLKLAPKFNVGDIVCSNDSIYGQATIQEIMTMTDGAFVYKLEPFGLENGPGQPFLYYESRLDLAP